MRDLVSRQAAIEALERIFDRCEEIEAHLPKGDPDRVGYKMYPDWLKVWKYLHQLPSAQPEIVRCKDCEYRHIENMVWICPFGLSGGPDFYCGYGAERRTDG